MKTLRFNSNTEESISEEKRRIYSELKAYRQQNGVGCFKAVSEATGGKIAIHTISHMYTGTKVNNDVWLQIGEALEALRNR